MKLNEEEMYNAHPWLLTVPRGRYKHFALSFEELLDFYCNTELSESSDLATSWQNNCWSRYLFLKIIFSVAEFISINQTLWDT